MKKGTGQIGGCLFGFMIVVAVFSGTACSNQAKKQAGNEYGVAWFCEVLNESNKLYTDNWKRFLQQMDEADDSFSFSAIDIFDANNVVEKQISDIETGIASGKYNTIVINPVDTVGTVPAYEAAISAGIKVIDVGGAQTSAKTVYAIGLDEDAQGETMRDYLANYLETNPGMVFNMCLLEGLPETVRVLPRLKYIRETLPNMFPGRVKILAEAWGLWRADEGSRITEDWIQAYPNLNIICSADDTMAMGVVNTVIAAGKDGGKILITGSNGDDGVLGFIRNGDMLATTGNYLGMMAKQYAEVTLKCAKGEWSESEKTYSMGRAVIELVDKSNVDAFTSGKYSRTE
jgi:ABC-type sugar transport system substrate-binding protein